MGVARRESAEVRKGLEEALGDEHAAVLQAIHAEREAAERRIAELEFNASYARARFTAVSSPGPSTSSSRMHDEDARQVFELREGILLRPRDGQTAPGDPLRPLQFDVWLTDQRERRSFLFDDIAPKH